MANIPSLMTGRELHAARGAGGIPTKGKYGEHLTYEIAPAGVMSHGDDWAALFDTSTNFIALVRVSTGRVEPALRRLTPTLLPYVNRFIADTGQKLEKYWRTGEYRLKSGTAAHPAAKRTAKRIYASAVALTPGAEAVAVKPEPKHEETHITIAPDTRAEVSEGVTGVPGLGIPDRAHVKSDGKGWLMVGDIVVPEADIETLNDAWALRQTGNPAAVLITGPAGTAKTALARAFAAAKQVPFLKVDGGAVRTTDDWAGAFRQDKESKTWEHRWSPFAQVLRRNKPAIVLIDELNRTESPQALNALLGLLDWTGTLLVPDANAVLTLPAGVLVIATANIGPEFVGTLPIDAAVRQRFPYGVRLDYPEPEREAKLVSAITGVEHELATRLVKLAGMQRKNREDPQLYPSGAVVSTRVVIDIARRIAQCGTEHRAAVLSTLRGQFESGDEKALIICVDTQFPAKPAKVKLEADDRGTVLQLQHRYVHSYDSASGLYVCAVRTTDPTSGKAVGPKCGLTRENPVHTG